MDVMLTLKILLTGVVIVFLLLLLCLTAPLTYAITLHGTQGQLGFHMICHNFFWEMTTRLADSRVATQQRILNQSLSKFIRSKPSAATHPAGMHVMPWANPIRWLPCCAKVSAIPPCTGAFWHLSVRYGRRSNPII